MEKSKKKKQSSHTQQLSGTGIISTLSGLLTGGLAGDAASERTGDKRLRKYQPLIKEFVQWLLKGIAQDDMLGIMNMCKGFIETAVEDLLSHTFEIWALKGATDEMNGELAEHLVVNLTLLCREELETPEDKAVQCTNIARRLMEETFPGKQDDPHLPKSLRDIFKKQGLLYMGASSVCPEMMLSWDQLIDTIGEQLHGLYDTIFNPDTPVKKSLFSILSEKHTPGAQKFLQALSGKVDAYAQTIPAIHWRPFSTKESNRVFQDVLKRLLHGDVASAEDRAVLQELRQCCIEAMQQNIGAILGTALHPAAHQSNQERRREIVEQVLSKALVAIPEARADQVAIKNMDDKQFYQFLSGVQNTFPGDIYPYYQEEIKHMLLKRYRQEAEARLFHISAHWALVQMLEPLLNEERLKKLLPEFITARAIVHALCSSLAPQFLQVQKEAVEGGEIAVVAKMLALSKFGFLGEMAGYFVQAMASNAAPETAKDEVKNFLITLLNMID